MKNISRIRNLLLLFAVITQIAAAQRQRLNPAEWPSFTVGPLEAILSGRPGKQINSSIRLITRNYDKPAIFTIETQDLGQENGNTSIPVPVGEGTRSCAEWIEIKQEVQAKGDETIEIPFTAKIPTNAKGSYFAYINVTSKPDRPDGQFAVLVKYRLPIKVEISIPGQAMLRLNCTDLSYDHNTHGSFPFLALNVSNDGFWKTTIEGDIVLRSMKTGQQQVIEIPYSTSGNALIIYPGIKVPIQCPVNQPLADGSYSATVRMRMNGFAKARAQFEFSVGTSKKAFAKLTRKEEYDLSLQVAPYAIEMPLRPGAIRNVPIRIMNKNELDINVQVSLRQATIEPNGSYTYTDIEKDDCISRWIHLSTDSLAIPPKRPGIVKLKIAVPNTLQGTFQKLYALRISATRQNTKATEAGQWDSLGEFPIPIWIYDAIAKSEKIECTKFEIIRPDEDKNPTAAILRIRNSGEKLAKIRGKISLEKAGKEYAYLDIGMPQPEMVLPAKEREFRFRMPTLDDGQFNLSAKLEFHGQKGTIALSENRAFSTVNAVTNKH
ncbi:hypothetical protein JXJ21_25710 [candidate division KSB1 bacterium]|nr:hypothetical protein [candidate division KSB1 bacterium]